MVIRKEIKEAIPNWEDIAKEAAEYELGEVKLVDHTPEELSVLYLHLSRALTEIADHLRIKLILREPSYIREPKDTDGTADS